jgi:hypothetical protein
VYVGANKRNSLLIRHDPDKPAQLTSLSEHAARLTLGTTVIGYQDRFTMRSVVDDFHIVLLVLRLSTIRKQGSIDVLIRREASIVIGLGKCKDITLSFLFS